MQIYHYSGETGEFLWASEARLDPLETKKTGSPVYLRPANSTPDAPSAAGEHQAAVYRDGAWSLVNDYRGQKYWNKDTGEEVTIQDLGALDADLVATEPTSGLFQPQWDGSQWIETALVYGGAVVASKADVDRVTRQRIVDLGEEKAKTEKILAGTEACAIWETFIAARAVILQEGEDFITANSLT